MSGKSSTSCGRPCSSRRRRSESVDGFQGASKFATWLIRIAINEGTDRLRMRKDQESLGESGSEDDIPFRPPDVHAWGGDPEEIYSRSELRQKVEEGLLKLPAKYRLPVMLRDLHIGGISMPTWTTNSVWISALTFVPVVHSGLAIFVPKNSWTSHTRRRW